MDAVCLHLGGESQRPPGHSLAFVAALLGQMGAAGAFAVKAAIVGDAFDEQQTCPDKNERGRRVWRCDTASRVLRTRNSDRVRAVLTPGGPRAVEDWMARRSRAQRV